MNLFDLSAVLTLDSSQYEQGINDARSSANGLTSSMNGIDGALGKAEKGFTVFKGVLSNVIGSGVNALASAITNNLGAAISRVDTLNNYTKVMANLGIEAEVSDKALNKLVEGIQDLPTSLPEIASLQQQFFALSNNMGESTKLAIALNDAVLAGGQGQEVANSALQQWYQIISKGKPDAQSWQIINDAMPAQLRQISQEMLGTSATAKDLKEAWMDGKVSTEEVINALIKLDKEGGEGITAFAEQSRSATAGIQTGMQNLRTAISTGLANIIDEFGGEGGQNFKVLFDTIKVGIKNSFGEVVTFIQNIKEFGFADALSKEIEKAKSVVNEGFSRLMDIDWEAVTSNAFSTLGGIFKTGFEAALDFQNLHTDLVTGIMSVADDMITGFIDAVTNQGPSIITTAIDVISNFRQGLIDNSARIASGAINLINNLVDYLSNNSDKIARSAVQMVLTLGKGLVKNAPKIISSAFKLAGTIITGALKIIPKLPPLAFKIVASLAKAIWSKRGEFLDVGLNIVKGIGNGITNGIGWIKKQISNFVGNVKSFLKKLFGISSPSKWARDNIGKMIDVGLANGIKDNSGVIDDAMNSIVPDIGNGFGLMSNVPSKGAVKLSYPVFNNNITVDGAQDPTEWATSFADALELKARAV